MKPSILIRSIALLIALSAPGIPINAQEFYECQGAMRGGYPCSNAVDGAWDTWTAPDAYNDTANIIEHYSVPAGITRAVWLFKALRNHPDIEAKVYLWEEGTSSWQLLFDSPVDTDYRIRAVDIPTGALLAPTLKLRVHLKNASALSAEFYEGVVIWGGEPSWCDDFEGSLVNWIPYQYSGGWQSSTSNPHSGTLCAKFAFPGGAGYYDASIKTSGSTAYVSAGIPYRVSWWMREVDTHDTFNSGTTILDPLVLVNGVPYNIPHEIAPSATWRRVEEIITFDQTGLAVLDFQLHGFATSASAEFAFDDVCIERVVVDSLFFPSVAVAPCDSGVSLQPVKVNLSKPAVGGVVTFKIPAGVSVVGIDRSGLVTQDWDNVQYSPQSGYAFARLNNQLGLRLQADTATILFIKFKSDRLCRQDKIIHWDTAQSTDPSRRTAFTDTLFSTFYPDFDNTHDSTRVVGYEPGDLDNSGGVDIADLSALIDYLYISFTPPCLLSAANVADFPLTNIDISDLSRLIDYLYISFLPLQCPSAAAEKSSTNQLEVRYVVNAQVSEGVTTISTFALASSRGLQLELSGSEGEMPVSLAGDKLRIYSGWKGGVLHVGIIDPTGKQFINAGNTPLIQLNGEFKILSATIADMEHRSVRPQIGSSAGTTLPTEYSLSQNYPNPFNPATTISFTLPVAGHVTVKVYNSIGQAVATLIDENRPAGAHQVTWDANKFASGAYLYRLTTDGFTETKKMLLMK